MSDPYGRVKGGRLAFKDGSFATRSKAIDKKKKKKKKMKNKILDSSNGEQTDVLVSSSVENVDDLGGAAEVYTIDAAKRMKYEELFPVEAKKFGYDPKNLDSKAKSKSVEEVLDDRVKKKADRYCK